MKKKILFPQISGMIHGGDYNPDQWLDRPDILEEDLRLMKKAGVNCVSLGIFAWSAYEPAEGEFHFRWLTDIMDRLYDNGIYTVPVSYTHLFSGAALSRSVLSSFLPVPGGQLPGQLLSVV